MITDIHVVFVELTQHVLAAVHRTAEPPGTDDLQVGELVGPGLLVRGWIGDPKTEQVAFQIEPQQLSAQVAEVDDGVETVQGKPRRYRIEDGKLKLLPTASILDEENTTVDFVESQLNVKVRLKEAVSEDTPVWVQIESGNETGTNPVNLSGTIQPAGGEDGEVDIPIESGLPAGPYRALILVKDNPVFMKRIEIDSDGS